jgi:hypothetical protein
VFLQRHVVLALPAVYRPNARALYRLLRRVVVRIRRWMGNSTVALGARTRDVADTATIEAGITSAGDMDAQGVAVPVTAGGTLRRWGHWCHMRRRAY